MVCLCKLRQKNPILVFGLALFSFKGYDGFRKGLMSCFFRKKVWERWGGRCRCGEKNWGSEVPYIYYGIGLGRLRALGLVGVGEEWGKTRAGSVRMWNVKKTDDTQRLYWHAFCFYR